MKQNRVLGMTTFGGCEGRAGVREREHDADAARQNRRVA